MKDEIFMIPGISGRPPMEVSKKDLCKIIEPRMEEIFEFAFNELNRSGFLDRLGAGVVVTGGTCLLKGTEELANKVFGMPVKLGIPTGISYSGLAPEVESPVYSTAVGLALYGLDTENNNSKYEEILESENLTINEEKKVESKIESKKQTKEIKSTDNEKPKEKISLAKKLKGILEQL